jgi:acyl carrier protein
MTTNDKASWVWAGVTEVFRTLFDDDRIVIGPDTTAEDIEGWDSLTHVQLMVLIEQRFGVHFNTGETAGLKSVGQMVDLIVERSSSA